MKILMLGNSFTYANDLPSLLAAALSADVTPYTRPGARLAEFVNPATRVGSKTLKSLEEETWDYVIVQEMSNGPVTARRAFFRSVEELCEIIRDAGATPVLYATWAYRPDAAQYAEVGMGYEEMAAAMSEAYQEAANENKALLADVGKRFYELTAERLAALKAEGRREEDESGAEAAARSAADLREDDLDGEAGAAAAAEPAAEALAGSGAVPTGAAFAGFEAAEALAGSEAKPAAEVLVGSEAAESAWDDADEEDRPAAEDSEGEEKAFISPLLIEAAAPLYAEDGSHPSEAGTRVAAEVLAEVIRCEEARRRPVDNLIVPQVKANDIRLRALYMYRILLQYTDSEHPLSTNQIRDLMEREYGISMHRTTVPGDIEVLKAAGFDIVGHRYRQNKYYLESRQFELAELKILIDAVESSKFITARKSRRLVDKLVTLTNEANADKLRRHLYISGRVRSANEKGYYIVDAINEAINEGKRISFFYTDYDGRKRQILRNDGNAYIVSPFILIWSDDFYYLVGYDHVKEAIRTYRVDRILRQPEVLDEAALPLPRDFDASRYTKEVFRMFEKQEPVEVSLICDDEVMKGVIDQFGPDIKVRRADKTHFKTRVLVCPSPTFFAWVFQWQGRVRIEGPDEVLSAFREMLSAF